MSHTCHPVVSRTLISFGICNTYLLIIRDTDVTVFMYFFAELRNFLTSLLHLFVDGISQISVVMFTTDQHFLKILMTKQVRLPLNREA